MKRSKLEFVHVLMRLHAFLRRANRQRGAVPATRRAFERVRRACAPWQVELVVDAPPGRRTVDYDVLLTDGVRETTMLGWHRDEGHPWSVDYAEHWAADFVVTVNGRHVTIREALDVVRTGADDTRDLALRIVDDALIAAAVERAAIPVTAAELARAGRIFRLVHDLDSDAALGRWLDALGTLRDAWEEQLRGSIQVAKWKDRLCNSRVAPYIRRRSPDLATLLVYRATARDVDAANALRAAARRRPLRDVVHEAMWRGEPVSGEDALLLRGDVPRDMRLGTVAGKLVGPWQRDGRYVLCAVQDVRLARDTPALRTLVRQRLVDEWLRDARTTASVQWHW